MHFPTNRTILEAVQILSELSRNTLTCLVTDIHSKLLNINNIDENMIPPVGSFVYLPDRLIWKKRASLISALGRVKEVQGRTVTIKLSTGYIVK